MNKIVLNFGKFDAILAGNAYGRRIYNEQLKGKIDLNQPIIVVEFPNQVEQLTSSFIQGFFYEIKDQIGLSGIEQKILINDNGKNFKQDIISNLQ